MPYAGCYVNAWCCISGHRTIIFGKRGLNASLGGVQFLRDGSAFAGGGVASADDFDDISEGADAEALI
ncbi:ssDNA-binding protein [Escherichia coli]